MDLGLQNDAERRNQDFIVLTRHFQETLRVAGMDAVPYRDTSLPYFTKMPSVLQEKLLESLAIESDIIAQIARSGADPVRSGKRLTLDFLKRTGLDAPDDLLLYLEDADHISIYNREQQMIFLSPNHFIWMTYSLEEVLCRPWFELFRRDPKVEQVLRQRAAMMITAGLRESVSNFDIPAHLVAETESPAGREVTCRSKLYTPLFRHGKAAGFLALNNGTVVMSELRTR